MIELPLKTTEKANWGDHIGRVLQSIYGSAASDFTKEIEALDRMRDAMMGVPPTLKGAQITYLYMAQLELLAMHIPMRPFYTEFTWHSVYGGEPVTQASIAFEKVGVSYNLGAALSHTASESFEREDYKAAYHDYCCAAGMFDYTAENFIFTASPDVAPSTLAMLSELMLAQAQHCFYLKAKQSQTGNPGLLAKLAASAASLYQEALAKLTLINEEVRWLDRKQLKDLETTQKLLLEQAHLEQAKHCETSTHKYGEAIAHLREAKKLASVDKNRAEDIAVKLRELERNNDLIYHDRVPAMVPEIKTTQAAKPLPLSKMFPEDFARRAVANDLFERVVPIEVHEKASLYSEMKAQFLRDKQEKAEIAGLELKSALEFMRLPSAISRLRQPTSELAEVPPEVAEWSVIINSAPRTERPDFDDQRKRILSLLKSQQSVNSNGGSAIENIHNIKQYLVSATETDGQLKQMYDEVAAVLPILTNTSKLHEAYANAVKREKAVPDVSLLDLDGGAEEDGGADSLETSLNEVSTLVAKLHKIQSERQTTLADLREKIHQDDITKVITANQGNQDIEKTVLEPELRKFDPLVRRLDATIRLQKSVLNDTAAKWKALLASPQAKRASADREAAQEAVQQLTERLRNGYEQWQALTEGMGRARTFYSDLERRALHLEAPKPPPKPPLPGKTPNKSPGDGLSGYVTPSAYNPSMYE